MNLLHDSNASVTARVFMVNRDPKYCLSMVVQFCFVAKPMNTVPAGLPSSPDGPVKPVTDIATSLPK